MPYVKVLRETSLTFITPDAATITWTNMPVAITEFNALTRHRQGMDLTNYTQVRIVVNVMVAGAATPALIALQYSIDSGVTWNYLDSTGANTGPNANISSTGLKVGSWVTIDSTAQADVWLRVIGVSGDAAADPQFGSIAAQFK